MRPARRRRGCAGVHTAGRPAPGGGDCRTIAALHAPILALWSTGFLAVIRVIEDYVVYPRLMARGIRLHPLAVILAVLAGLELGGVAGIFLAIPVVAALSVTWRHGASGWTNRRSLYGCERPGNPDRQASPVTESRRGRPVVNIGIPAGVSF